MVFSKLMLLIHYTLCCHYFFKLIQLICLITGTHVENEFYIQCISNIRNTRSINKQQETYSAEEKHEAT